MIIAAADGSALGNPGPAGWAWYVDDDCWAAGGWPRATNNQGELQAVLELFRATAHLDDELHVLCDSQYVINTVTKWMAGWKRKGWRKADGKPVLNLELVQALDAELAGRRFRFEWVRGHVGHELNEAADARARAAATAYQQKKPVPSGPGWTGACEGADASAAASANEPVVSSAPEAAPETSAAGGTSGAPETSAPETSALGTSVPETSAFETSPRDDRTPADATLFDFEDPAADWLTLSVELTTDEHTRLIERAREAGVSPEEFLRGLI